MHTLRWMLALAVVGLAGCNLISPPYTLNIAYHNAAAGSAPPTVDVYLNGVFKTALVPVFDLGGSTDGTATLHIGPTDQVCLIVRGTALGYRYASKPNRSMYGFGIQADGATIISLTPLNDNLNETTATTTCP